MKVCFITADPGHRLVTGVADLLVPDHQVSTLSPGAGGAAAPTPADVKFWGVDDRVFTAVRRSTLIPPDPGPPPPLPPPLPLPPAWALLARRAGRAMGLEVYGVDIIVTGPDEPLVVDVNAFPGGLGSHIGGPQALADKALHGSRRIDPTDTDRHRKRAAHASRPTADRQPNTRVRPRG
ncbi:hypothetical protein OG216_01050 [Streptomycetaceae bacterium NBC_01309]